MLEVKVTGHLLDTDGTAIANRQIVFYSSVGIFSSCKKIEVFSDDNGGFSFNYPASAKTNPLKSLILAIQDNGKTLSTKKITFSREMDSDLGTIELPLYPISEGLPLEQTWDTNHANPFDPANISFFANLAIGGFGPNLKSFIESERPNATAKEVQKAFGQEKRKLRSADVIDMLLNGICPVLPEKGQDQNELIINILWEGIEQDGSADLPDARFVLKAVGEGYSLKEVAVRFPGSDWEVKRRGEGEEYRRVLHLAASAAIVKGEAEDHLGRGHLMSGFYTLAFMRHIQKNPILNLLKPHLNEKTLRINQLGDNLIFGETGVLNQSGLSPDGIKTLIERALGESNYFAFSPRKPLCKKHRFAKILQTLWWDVAFPAAGSFIQKNEEGIREHWNEIYQLSETLVKKSVPVRDSQAPQRPLVDARELDLYLINRVEYKGKLRSFRPITTNPHNPSTIDLVKLKHWLAHALFTTFWHHLLHTSQEKDVTNLKFVTLAPQNHGYKQNTKERDHYAGTTASSAAAQLSVVHTLLNYRYEKLMDDPNVYDVLKLLLERNRHILKGYGLNINDLMTCVEI